MDRFTESVVNAYRARALLFTAERPYKGGHAKPVYWDSRIVEAVNEKKLSEILLDPEAIVGFCGGKLPVEVVEKFALELDTSTEEAQGVYQPQEIVEECIGKWYFEDLALRFIAKQMRKRKSDIRGVIPDNATDVYALEIAENELTAEKGYDKNPNPEWKPGYSNLVHMRITQTGKDSSFSFISVPPYAQSSNPGRVDISRFGFGQSRKSHGDFTKQTLADFARNSYPVVHINLARAKTILMSDEFTTLERDLHHSAEILEVV